MTASASRTGGALDFGIPPLTESFTRLLALSEKDREDLRLLELLVHRDPGAVARLLQLANSAVYSRGRAATSVSEALQVLGSETAISALMSLWALDELEVAPQYKVARAWLARHTFSLCATMRRMLQSGRMGDEIPFLPLQLTALVDKLALATVLSVQERTPEMATVVQNCALEDQHALHQVPELDDLFLRAQRIATAWRLDSTVLPHLQDLQDWRQRGLEGLSVCAQAPLLGEVALAAAGREENPYEEVLESFYEKSSLMHRLVERRINPLTLAVRF